MSVPEERDRIMAASNTGPLISAFQCDGTELLKRYLAGIYITSTEMTELTEHGWQEATQELVAEGLILLATELSAVERDQARALARRIAEHSLSRNPDPSSHLPEAEMLTVALRMDLHCRIVLLDEKAARAITEEIGLRVTGFPGILARAGLDGLLSSADIRRLLKLCRRQGTHYSDILIEHVARTYGR